VLASLVAVIALAWIWLLAASRDMYGAMSGWAAWMMVTTWTPQYFLLVFVMWAAMMLGMMLPSATPVILLYGRIVRSSLDSRELLLRQYSFAAGYLLAWTAFSLGATLLQWTLSETSLMSMMMELSNRYWAAGFLIIAGLYQWTPAKRNCLSHCQSPAIWLTEHWRTRKIGALRMGTAHGLYCVGCCWALMGLLFVGGVMSLSWIAGLTALVLLEKLLPPRIAIDRWAGLAAVLAGLSQLR
jgi:predicted metal-binding membrane protein